MTLTRRQSREWAIQMLTAAELNPPDDVAAFMADFWLQFKTLGEEDGAGFKAHGKLKAFAEEIVTGVLSHREEIDGILGPLLANWDLIRLGTVERTVLRMGIWELKYAGTPAPVAINEAVDVANWFSSPQSRTLVNGILDKYAKSL